MGEGGKIHIHAPIRALVVYPILQDMYAVLTPDRYMRGKEEELEALKKNNHM